jgi:dTMP kinase
MANKKGIFIVFEGIGASGKDTQVEMFEKKMRDDGIDVLVTREHTRDTPTGVLIERIIKRQEDQIDPQALQLLFVSDRRNHFTKVIESALNEGKLVISNRYYAVNVAYLDEEWREKFLKINQMVVGRPDLIVIIDTPPQVALERMNKRGDHDIFDKLETMEKCREGYLWFAKNSGDKCVLINGDGTKEEVFGRILVEINKLNIIKAGDKI